MLSMVGSAERSYDEKSIRELQENFPYHRDKDDIDQKDEEEKNEDKQQNELGSFPIKEFFLGVFILIVIAFLVGLLVKFQKSNFKIDGRDTSLEMDEELDELAETDDLELVLKEALRLEDYRMAIRVEFLLAIQGLGQLDLIKIEKGKTAQQYIYALNEPEKRNFLSELNYLYNYSWYGGFPVVHENYLVSEELRLKILK